MDIVGQLPSLAEPGFLQSLAERFQLRDEIRVGDWKWSILTDIFEFGTKLFVVVMIGGWLKSLSALPSNGDQSWGHLTRLVEIFLHVLPGPVISAKFRPFVKGCSTARDPSVVVEGTTSSKHLATSIRLFHASAIN